MGFLFGNTSNLPLPDQKPLGVDSRRVSTNEQARPVPYARGLTRLGVTFISDVFEVRTDQVTRDAGKQKSAVGYNYYASFACLICHGPLESLRQIYLNGEVAWGGVVNFGSADYVDVTIPGYGQVRVYSGTETQMPNEYLVGRSGILHGGYRGLAFAVFTQLFFGFNQTNVPNIEFSVRSAPGNLVNSDANAGDVLRELWTHPRAGLGLSTDALDNDSIDAVVTSLADHNLGVSPVIDRAQEMGQHVVALLEYVDGFTTIANGKLALGLVRPANPDDLPSIDETVMSSRPQLTPSDWSDDSLASETRLVYTNRARSLQEDQVIWRDAGLAQITGEAAAQTLQRPWATSKDVASTLCAAAGRAAALPPLRGQVKVFKTDALRDALTPGALFKLNYAARGLVDFVCRITLVTINSPQATDMQIDFMVDRSYLYPLVPDPEEGGGGGGEEEAPVADPPLIIELPLALCPDGVLSLAALLARPAADVTGYVMYLGRNFAPDWGGPSGTDTYEVLASHNRFAVGRGVLLEDYPDATMTETVDVSVGLSVLLDDLPDHVLDEQHPFDALADDLLVFVDDEILSVHRVELLAARTYRLYVARGRFATTAAAHLVNAQLYIYRRTDLQPLQHAHLQTNNTAQLKFVLATGRAVGELSGATPIDYPITGRIFSAPPPTNPQINGSLRPTFGATDDITITWTKDIADRDFYQQHRLSITTILEFRDGVTLLGFLVSDYEQEFLTAAQLLALLGSTIDFTLRAYIRVSGDWFTRDSDPVDLEVTFVP